MTSSTPRGDIGPLIDLYADRTPERRPPWNPALLDDDEFAALEGLIADFIADYNAIFAITEDELIPTGCWREHDGLFRDLAVQAWAWYAANVDPAATALAAVEYQDRHLPLFRSRLDRWLGRLPMQCRRGEHDPNWRKPADDLLGAARTAGRARTAAFGFST
ncbi:hypothetical protein [Kutzneria sp. 744]|uniref:hypothetical protein n=1 Tax=Kutzneria sp. (strain 744) TaxID=345341 RepID=UPI0003EEA7D6|nr:hypothetical protein [Kutzneria sp. 744]EWM19739.1 hypothetical protein KUTG_10043 [Kutzneria sp. 744]